jgi:hypothetical protein
LSGGNARSDFYIAGRQPPTPSEYPAAQVRWVSPEYFETMGIALEGRGFTELDSARSRPVIVVDRALASRFFSTGEAIGAHIVLDEGTGDATLREIVGVGASVKHFTIDEQPLPTIYIPIYQTSPSFVPKRTTTIQLVVRARDEPMRVAEAVRERLARLAADVPSSRPRTIDQFWSAAMASRRFTRTLFTTFAVTALLLAASAMYAVISFGVAHRTRELGIRMALGARRATIHGLVLAEGLRIIVPGVLAGVAGSFAAGRLVEGLLFGVAPFDAVTLSIAAGILTTVAVLATIIPARRATRIDPAIALRPE